MRKIREGVVISEKMNKTRIVLVRRQVRDPLYEKIIRKKKKYYMHDENNLSHLGDKVKIIESRPLSRLKCWRLLDVVGKANDSARSPSVRLMLQPEGLQHEGSRPKPEELKE